MNITVRELHARLQAIIDAGGGDASVYVEVTDVPCGDNHTVGADLTEVEDRSEPETGWVYLRGAM